MRHAVSTAHDSPALDLTDDRITNVLEICLRSAHLYANPDNCTFQDGVQESPVGAAPFSHRHNRSATTPTCLALPIIRSEEVGLRYGREAPAGRRLEPAWFKTYRDTVDEPKTTGVKGCPRIAARTLYELGRLKDAGVPFRTCELPQHCGAGRRAAPTPS